MPALTFGVEEEFHLVDLESRHTAALAEAVLRELDDESIVPELKLSTIETNSAVCLSTPQLREDLAGLRQELFTAASRVGAHVAASGTLPLVGLSAIEPYPKSRYIQMSQSYPAASAQQVVCGVQTQVGVPDRDLAVRVLSHAMPWTPVLTALAGSSPYWFGEDTGYASYRTHVWDRWPSAGPAAPFKSAAEYDDLVTALVQSETILDEGMVYFDVRLSSHQPTIEFRTCDATPNLDHVVAFAALSRALVATCLDDANGNEALPRVEMVRAARWRAARDGLNGSLLDPIDGHLRPAAEAVERLVDHVRVALVATGEFAQVVDAMTDILDAGGSANQQRKVFQQRESLIDVVDDVAARTRSL